MNNNQKHTELFDDGQPKKLTDEMLLAYMEGELVPDQQRAVEEWLSEEGPESDALEGLYSLNTTETKRTVDELNKILHTNLLRKKPKRKNALKEDYWAWIAVIVILLLVLVGYVVVRLAQH
jgi:hypothetical protein